MEEPQSPEGPGRKRLLTPRVLGMRVLVGVILIPVVLVVTYLGGLSFALFVGLLAGLGSYELYEMSRRSGWHPSRALGIAGSILLCVCFGLRGLSLAGPVLAALLIALLIERIVRSPRERYLADLAITLFGIVYCGWLLGFFISLRNMGGAGFAPPAAGSFPAGTLLVYFILVLAWSYDSIAYLAGSLVGRRKLFPRVSPSKTLEGTIAGLCGCAAAAAICRATFAGFLRLPDALVVGFLVGVAAQAGDLAESMIKRSLGAKDSSNLIPGHGGFLDRFDSLLFAGPVFYFYVRIFLS